MPTSPAGLAIVVLLAIVLLAACAIPRSTLPVVKIGLIAPFEGLGRPLGYEVLHAVKLAVQESNASGDLGEYRVALVALNDDDLGESAAQQALKMGVDSDVLGVVGPMSRATIRAAARPLGEAGLAWVVPASVPDDLLAKYGHAFRVFASDAELADAAVEQALVHASEPGRLAVPLSGDFSPALAAAASRHGVTVEGDELGRVKGVPVALGGTATEVANALIMLEGRAAAVVAGPEAGRLVVPQWAEEAADGLIWVSSVPPADSQSLPPAFAESYRTLAGGLPGPYAVLAYEATHVLLDAIARDIGTNGRPTRPGILAALPQVSRSGLAGVISFDDLGAWEAAPVFVYRMSGQDIYWHPQAWVAEG